MYGNYNTAEGFSVEEMEKSLEKDLDDLTERDFYLWRAWYVKDINRMMREGADARTLRTCVKEAYEILLDIFYRTIGKGKSFRDVLGVDDDDILSDEDLQAVRRIDRDNFNEFLRGVSTRKNEETTFRRVVNPAPVRVRSRARRVRVHGRHVSRSFFAAADSGGGGDDGGDGQSDSDCYRHYVGFEARGINSAQVGHIGHNENIIFLQDRALSIDEHAYTDFTGIGAFCVCFGGRFFCTFSEAAA